jgi:hypothetical protein
MFGKVNALQYGLSRKLNSASSFGNLGASKAKKLPRKAILLNLS